MIVFFLLWCMTVDLFKYLPVEDIKTSEVPNIVSLEN